MLVERDFVMRLIKQLVELIARVLNLAKAKKADEAQAVLEAGCLSLLGMDFHTLALVDSASAADLLQQPYRVVAFARLLGAQAEIERARGAEDLAHSHDQHALELVLEALRRSPSHAEALSLGRELRPRVDVTRLPDRYAAGLTALGG